MAVPAMLEHEQHARGTLVAIFGSTDERAIGDERATGPLATRVRIVKKGVECSPTRKARVPHRFPLHGRSLRERGAPSHAGVRQAVERYA